MGMLANIIPGVTVLLLALVSVLPWGVGDAWRFGLPASCFMAVQFWQHAHPGLVPPVFVAAVGLSIDVLSYGPLGYWALVFLAGLTVSVLLRRWTRPADWLGRWLCFLAVSTGLAVAAFGLACAYAFQLVDWRPMGVGFALLVLVYPVLALLLGPLERLVTGPRILNFDRRR